MSEPEFDPVRARRLLGVEAGADEGELRSAYRRQAARWHPDVSPGDEAAERFMELTAARDALLQEIRSAAGPAKQPAQPPAQPKGDAPRDHATSARRRPPPRPERWVDSDPRETVKDAQTSASTPGAVHPTSSPWSAFGRTAPAAEEQRHRARPEPAPGPRTEGDNHGPRQADPATSKDEDRAETPPEEDRDRPGRLERIWLVVMITVPVVLIAWVIGTLASLTMD